MSQRGCTHHLSSTHSILTQLLNGFISICWQPSFARLVQTIAVNQLCKGANQYTSQSWLLVVTVNGDICFFCRRMLHNNCIMAVCLHLCTCACVSLLPCSDRDSSVPFFRNHWPSMLPVTENAQQDPHIPCMKHDGVRMICDLFISSVLFRVTVPMVNAACWYLILNRADSSMLPPIPAGRGGTLGGSGRFHWSVESPLTQERVQVRGAKLFLWKKTEGEE